jgi:hypothetical protein
LVITLPTSGGCSVGIFRSRTKATELVSWCLLTKAGTSVLEEAVELDAFVKNLTLKNGIKSLLL